MKKFLALILSLAMVFALVACGGEKTDDSQGDTSNDGSNSSSPVSITLATGGTTGTYYAVGNALVTTLDGKLSLSKLTAVDSGASKANVQLVTAGSAQMSILQSDVLNYAHNGAGGETMFDGAADTNSLWVAGVYNETVQLVTSPDITDISQLKGKTVCVGDVGSGTEINAWQVLGAAGLTKDDVKAVNGSFQDGVDQLKDGKIDAAFTVAGAPTTAIVDYATTNTLNLVSLSDDELAAIQEAYPFLIRDDLAAGTYTGQDADVTCVAIQATLVASEELSEDVVYEFVKAMFDNKDALTEGHAKFGFLDPEAASAGATVTMHPGAEKYYKEIGVL